MSGSDAASRHSERSRFWRITGAGAAFQAGAAAIDSATVVASLVFQLTGSAFAVGFASAMLRLGWLLPQLVVGFLAERAERRMPFYVFGAYGRALMAALIALLLWFGGGLSPALLGVAFLALFSRNRHEDDCKLAIAPPRGAFSSQRPPYLCVSERGQHWRSDLSAYLTLARTAANGRCPPTLLKDSLLQLQISGMWETVLRRADCAA